MLFSISFQFTFSSSLTRATVRLVRTQKRMGGETPARLFERCVMRRETGNKWKEKTKMAAQGRGTENPGELEDLKRILSLADDADEEFI